MEFERDVLVSPTAEVPVIEGEMVTAIRTLAESRGRQEDDCPRGRRRGQYGPAVSASADRGRACRCGRRRGG